MNSFYSRFRNIVWLVPLRHLVGATSLLLLGLASLGGSASRSDGGQLDSDAERALRESEEQFRQLAEHIQEVFWITDRERLIYISPVYEQVWGRPCPGRLETGSPSPEPGCWLDAAHPDDREHVQAAFQHRFTSPYEEEYRILRPDGSVRWIHERAYPIYDSQGKVYRVCGTAQDITDQVLAKQELERRVEEGTREMRRRQQVSESLRRMLAVLNSDQPLEIILDHIIGEAVQVLDAEAVAIYRLRDEPSASSDAAPNRQGTLVIQAAQGLEPGYVADARIPVGQSVTGQAVREQRSVTLEDVAAITPGDLPLDEQRRELLERLGTRYRALIAVPLITDEVYGAITLYYQQPRRFSPEDVGMAVAFGDQVALAIQNAQLRAQIAETAVASERQRLARDLHDSVTQVLFSASLTAEVLPIVWERNRSEGQQALEDLRQLTRGALAEMRTLLLELRPAALREARLEELLHQLAEAVMGRARIPIVVEVTPGCELPADIRVAFYRIAQEALNNVAKHADAGQAQVRLECLSCDDHITEARLYVSDNGVGFDPHEVSPEHGRLSLGLGIMQERADAIGAFLTLESEPGEGTRIHVTWLARDRSVSQRPKPD